jgi:16S rRNA (uracil1498-N3)-methyltransferase
MPVVHARFYAPDAHHAGDVVALPDDEARHLTRVLRLSAGHAVRVFNGRGAEFEGVVDQATRGSVTIRVGGRREPASEARVAITLAQAVLKGDKMDDVVRDAVMMGAAAIQPVITTRTEVARAAVGRGRRRERWERIAISSAKQCGRAVVPPVLEPIPFEALLEAIGAMSLPGLAVMCVEPRTASDAASPGEGEIDARPPREATVMVGPEGGWTPKEVEAAAGSCRFITCGGRTLRADITAVVALAVLFTRWNEF